jgi:alkanesulfonate monooxygenase SsuD/methylene tetrahydromethanopterin reductase-like flavin-dependent oxidoreductase (luciferase family)
MASGLKIGMHLHPERGVDAVLAEARAADEQGYDAVWLADHLMRESEDPDGGLDAIILMTAIAAQTRHVRLAWAALNPSFRKPAILAKMLATLDRVSHGRVICTLGAGSDPREYPPYELEWIEDHDARIAYGREVVLAMRELWTHPAPARTTFEGEYVHIRDLAFNPSPYQQPHPPIWAAGNSEATQRLVKEYADGWMLLTRSDPRAAVEQARRAPDWPDRPLEIVAAARVIPADTAAAAERLARSMYEAAPAATRPASFEAFVEGAIVGTPERCAAGLLERTSWGLTHARVTFPDAEQQAYFAETVLPLVRAGR